MRDERWCMGRYTACYSDAWLFERRPVVLYSGETGDIHHVSRLQSRCVSASNVDAPGRILDKKTAIAQHCRYRAPHVHPVRGSAFVAESLQTLDGPYRSLQRLTRRALQYRDVTEILDVQQRAQNLVLAIENRSRNSHDSYFGFHQLGGKVIKIGSASGRA